MDCLWCLIAHFYVVLRYLWAQFVICLAFKVRERARYPNLYHPDYLGGNSLCILLPREIELFLDKVRVETVTYHVGVWYPSWPLSLLAYIGICSSPFPTWLCQDIRAKQVVKYLLPARQELWFDCGGCSDRCHCLTRSSQGIGPSRSCMWLVMGIGQRTRWTAELFQVLFVWPTNQGYCSVTRQRHQHNQSWTFITLVEGLKVPSV